MSASAALATFAAETASVPDAVRREAIRSIMNGFATGLAGCGDAATLHAKAVATRFSARGEASIMGHPERVDILTAAFLNAIAINVHDFDDTHPGTILHPTAPVLPPLLALAETRAVTGAAFLDAFAIGVEVECRIANAVSPGHYRRGWHITATCGVFGAAAASGRILGLDAERMLHALGIASAQASGLVETLGTMAKSVGVGNAARNGLFAALLAENGLKGPALPLEGPRGFVEVTSDEPRPGCLAEGLGESWQLLLNTYKPYPCGVVLNPVIEAALLLAAEPGFDAARVQGVTVRGAALLAERADRPSPAEGREAQVSAQHAVAVAFLRGRAGLAEFSDAAVADPAVQALRETVRVAIDPQLPVGAAVIDVRLPSGSLSRRVDKARGDGGRPLADADIEEKLRALADYGAPSVDTAPLIAALRHSPDATDMSGLARFATP
ncbi:MmgE/PrpD family protein [Aureimonas populi]|uniref:MmgE/PrpD family protein n=1 Tax=Aureimonas populi TaxID=1701758 RepID=A0ABW5CRX1_9HYPH|nr:MmgE/PrpD family protein [Aureimonas populi]